MAPASQHQTTCPYCGVGCGVTATVSDGKLLTGVTGTPVHPANLGRLCVKGSALQETMGLQGRLLYPQVRGCRTDWNTALDVVSSGFRDIVKRHGPNAVAFYLSGQLLTEDYYVANKLMKGFIGSGNVDTNSRLCMASAVAGYKRAFGGDAVPCCYEDLESCDLLVMVGSNAAWTHPVVYQRIVAAKTRRPDMKIVVIDPRRTASCDLADLHLPVAPGADGFVFAGLLHYLNDRQCLNNRYIEEHSEGFEEAVAAACTVDEAAAAAGLERSELEQFYRWFARTEMTVTLYSQGINQSASGTDKCNAIINCHIATGRIGRPGMGPFSITGQPNAMGGREVGGMANTLAAHMDFQPEDVDRLGRFWKSGSVASGPGLKALAMFDAIGRGEIRAIWIMATNPLVSLPDSDRIRKALQRCELVVVSDCIERTDTTVCADVLLPAAGWGEKDGTVTNSERCISRQRALLPAAGQARPDWRIICDVAAKMGYAGHFSYPDAAAIFREHAALSAFENAGLSRRAFNIGGLAHLSSEEYENLAPVQWPVPEAATGMVGTARLFADGQYFTPNGRARFIAVRPVLPQAAEQLPFVLNSGRIRDQWHTMTRSGRTQRLLSHIDKPFIAMSPRDALAAGIRDGDLLRVHNRQGNVLLQAVTDSGQKDGELFAPIHWNDQFASRARISSLFSSQADPLSGQPQSKFVRVALTKITVRCWAQLVSRDPIDLSEFDYWVRIPAGSGSRYLLAMPAGTEHEPMIQLLQRLQPAPAAELQKIVFSNPAALDYRVLFCAADSIRLAAYIAPRLDLLPGLQSVGALLEHRPGPETWRLLQQAHQEDSSRVICSCHQVTLHSITRAISEGARSPADLGRALRCGTNCGSCIPELQKIVADAANTSSVPPFLIKVPG